MLAAFSGDFAEAASLLAESNTVCEAIGTPMPPFTTLQLACLRGRPAEAIPLIDATIKAAEAAGQGFVLVVARWVAAVHYNGLGRYDEAREAARQAAEDPFGFHVSLWALPELIEAAARSGNMLMAGDALQRLAATTQAGGNDWGLGIEARSRALVAGAKPPMACTGRRSTGWAAPGFARSWPARTCSTESGCGARAAAVRRGSSCAPPTAYLTRSGWKHLPNGPGASCWPPGKPPASAPRRPPPGPASS